jgi:predicted RNA methylase
LLIAFSSFVAVGAADVVAGSVVAGCDAVDSVAVVVVASVDVVVDSVPEQATTANNMKLVKKDLKVFASWVDFSRARILHQLIHNPPSGLAPSQADTRTEHSQRTDLARKRAAIVPGCPRQGLTEARSRTGRRRRS